MFSNIKQYAKYQFLFNLYHLRNKQQFKKYIHRDMKFVGHVIEDLITYQPTSYPGELFNIAVYYLYLRLRETNRSELLKLPRLYVYNDPSESDKSLRLSL